MIRQVTYILFFLLVLGCKTIQPLTNESALNPKLNAKQILKIHNKQKADFTTLQARLRLELTEGDKSQAHTVTLRMERDKTIWINAFLNMVRLKITPDRVLMYNKINKIYFEGDFRLINDFLGVDLDFKNLQNLLLAELIFSHKPNQLKQQHHETSYCLTPKKQNAFYDLLYFINPQYYKLDGLVLSQPRQNRILKVNYDTFQSVDQQIIPQQMTLRVTDNQSQMILNINLKSVSLNSALRFPFKLPSGYKLIEL